MRILLLCMIVVCLYGCFDSSKQPKASGKQVTIAVIATIKGAETSFGMQGIEGFKAALRAYPLLSNGDKINVRFIGSDGLAASSTELDFLVNKKRVKALVSIQNSDTTLKLGPGVIHAQLPTIVVTATHEAISNNTFFTQLSMNSNIEGDVAAFYSRDEMLLDRVGIVYDAQNAFSTSLARRFKTTFENLGGTITHFVDFPKPENLREALHRDMQKQDVELIYAPLFAEKLMPFLGTRSAESAIKIMGPDGLLSNVLQKSPESLENLDGLLVVEHFADMMPDTHTARLANSQLKLVGIQPTTVSYLGFESYLLLRSALETCNDYKMSCINEHLRNSSVIEGVGGIFRISKGQSERPVFVNQIKDGALKMLVKIY